MQRPRTPASALAVERARARETFRGKLGTTKTRAEESPAHAQGEETRRTGCGPVTTPVFVKGVASRTGRCAYRPPARWTPASSTLESACWRRSSTIARPATAARALSDRAAPSSRRRTASPASPQSRGLADVQGARPPSFRRPAKSLQARQSFRRPRRWLSFSC